MSELRAQQDLLMQLLFDADLRARFGRDRAAAVAEAGLTGAGAAPFMEVDLEGLELDASMRRGYLMSALCRPFPIAAGALGALAGGAPRLARFLSGRALTRSLSERTRAFGSFLGGVLEQNEPGASEALLALIRAFLELERARAAAAAALRADVEAGREPARHREVSNNALKRGRVSVPRHFLAAELPVPTSVMVAALHQIGPENAWSRIESGALSAGRLETVARARQIEVTVLSRAVVVGRGLERAGAGGVSPVIDVAHRTVELTGRRGAALAAFDGTRRLADLPAPLASLGRNLVEAGLLDVVER